MRLTLDELQMKRGKSAKLRAQANFMFSGRSFGGRPRAQEETNALARASYNRMKKAVENGSIDMSHFKTERRIIFNVFRS